MRSRTTTDVIEVTLAGQRIRLLGSGAAFWCETSTLFIADLHLGKTTTFRRGGLPVPPGATTATIHKLVHCIEQHQPERVVVLGDLIHARCSWDQELTSGFDRIFHALRGRPFLLIRGNHDRGSLCYLAEYPIEIVEPPHGDSPWILVHDEAQERPAVIPESHIVLAGHLHPGVRLGRTSAEHLRLPCFWLRSDSLTFPSFGEFTGHQPIRPARKIDFLRSR